MAEFNPKDTSLLSLVLASHGGLRAWQKIRGTTFKYNFSGAFLAIKGFPGHFQPHVHVDFTVPRTEIRGLSLERPTDTWIWTPERVWTQDANGTVQQTRSEPCGAYKGHTRNSKWDQFHLTYFIGYALWNYASYPFVFAGPGFETREIKEHWEPGYVNSSGVAESWRVLEVTFPENYHTHTRQQKFYFDREKLWIRRMDYETDVAKGIATHYCFDHKLIKGIVVPMLRRVVSRRPGTDTAMTFGPSVFTLDYFDVDFEEIEVAL